MTDKLEPWICPECGEESQEVPDECPFCGAIAYRIVGNKKRKTAILLALFLGWIGGHRFYLRKYISGILSVIFFWTLIPFFFSLIDILEYVILGAAEFHIKYNKLVPASEAPDDIIA